MFSDYRSLWTSDVNVTVYSETRARCLNCITKQLPQASPTSYLWVGVGIGKCFALHLSHEFFHPIKRQLLVISQNNKLILAMQSSVKQRIEIDELSSQNQKQLELPNSPTQDTNMYVSAHYTYALETN